MINKEYYLITGVHEWPTNEYYWLADNLTEKIYRCKLFPGICSYSTNLETNLDKHVAVCADEARIYSKQIALGNERKVIDELIENTALTSDLRDYRVTKFVVYDIETLEESPSDYVNDQGDENRYVQAYLKLATIATASNIDGDEPRYFERLTSNPKDEQNLVNLFMDHLFDLTKKHKESIPAAMKQEFNNLNMKIGLEYKKPKKLRSLKQLMTWQRHKNQLASFMVLNVYGFNSSKFDLPILLPAIARYCHQRGVTLERPLKKTGYMSLQVGQLCFKDVLSFTSPVRLEKYLKQWNASEAKSLFPYR